MEQETETVGQAPVPDIPFKLADARNTIRKGCFEISTFWGIKYFIQDLLLIGMMYYLRPYFCHYIVTRCLWWNIQGFFFWCFFIIGHDCGHRTFSKSKFLNDLFGHVSHTVLLVPFHGWRLSHRGHHKHHNHVEKDVSWKILSQTQYTGFRKGATRSWFLWYFFHTRHTPFLMLLNFPLYLVSENVDGNHFNPWTKFVGARERVGVAVSTVAVFLWIGFLVYLGNIYGSLVVVDLYVIPWYIFTVWLSLVTFLQHTNEHSRYFRDEAWQFIYGALETVDRSYGSVIDKLMHHINIHVAHHLFFTEIPHYQLATATEDLKMLLGDKYRYSSNFFLWDYVVAAKKCFFVPNRGKCVKYINKLQKGEKYS